MTQINPNNITNVSFQGIWGSNNKQPKETDPTIEQIKDGGRKIMDGLGAMAAGAKTMIHKAVTQSSAPKVTNAENNVYSELQRLRKQPIETVQNLETCGYEPKINKEGLFVTMNVPYTGVVKNEQGGLIEYVDGKPVTVVVNESNGNFINQRVIKYEYPEGSIAALKTETSIINEYNHNLGYSMKVPTAIHEETGLNIYKDK